MQPIPHHVHAQNSSGCLTCIPVNQLDRYQKAVNYYARLFMLWMFKRFFLLLLTFVGDVDELISTAKRKKPCKICFVHSIIILLLITLISLCHCNAL